MRYAIRSLRRAPVFTTVVILTLGLGIGANAAIFSVLNAIVLKPLGYAGAERLVAIHELAREIPLVPRFPVNAMHVDEWRRTNKSPVASAPRCGSCRRESAVVLVIVCVNVASLLIGLYDGATS